MKTSSKFRSISGSTSLADRLSSFVQLCVLGTPVCATVLVLWILAVNPAPAQDLARETSSGKDEYFDTPNIRTALAYRFSQKFPSATEVHWTHRDSVELVRFIQEGLVCGAVYNRAHELKSSLTHYTADRIPKEILGRIYRSYPHHKVTTGTELVANGTVTFRAVLENSNRFVIITVTNEGIREVQRLKKYDYKNLAQRH